MTPTNRIPVNVGNATTVAGEADPLTPHEVKHLKGINPFKTVRPCDGMHVAEGPRGGMYVVLEGPGSMYVYRVGVMERSRLAAQFRGSLWAVLSRSLASAWGTLTRRGKSWQN